MPIRLLRCQGEPGITSASLSCLKFDVKPILKLNAQKCTGGIEHGLTVGSLLW